MTTVVIRPRTLSDDDDVELVQLHVITAVEDWVGLFDRLEIWRATASSQGPYTELTGASWCPARVPDGSGERPSTIPVTPAVSIAGLDITLRVDGGQEYTVVFVGPDPVTYESAAAQITAAGTGFFSSYVASDSSLVVEGVHAGTGATLEIVGGEAAVLLGLSVAAPGNFGRGRDARISLVEGRSAYNFIDPLGSTGYFYKTRYRNARTGAVSEFSFPHGVASSSGVPSENLVCGYVDLVRGDGGADSDRLVQVYASTSTTLIGGRLVTASRMALMTDNNGHAEFMLVRGIQYTVSVSGTDLVRDIVAPIDPGIDRFNILEAAVSAADDAFKVQVPDLVYAARRTL